MVLIKILKEENDSAFCMLLGNRLKSAEPEYLWAGAYQFFCEYCNYAHCNF